MAAKLKRPCAYPGCPALVSAGRFCERHKRQDYRVDNARRGTAAQRGYDGRWQRVREMYLRQHPLCEVCEAEGRVTPATMVHHKQPIKAGGRALDIENLMAVCVMCHNKIHSKKS